MSPRVEEIPRRAARIYAHIEGWTIVTLMVVLVLFALYQILLRNLFSTGIIWGDSFLRHIVLWIGLLGACRATAEDRHIHVELTAFIPHGRIRSMLSLARALFVTAVSAALLHASWTFLVNERSAGDLAFLQVPNWWLETIFPLSFGVMTLRGIGQIHRGIGILGHGARP
jgi:TRAP-type C4-dicarboxylate transport system permease small subunit